MSTPTKLVDENAGGTTSWIESLQARAAAGELGMSEEELTAADNERRAALEAQSRIAVDRRLQLLRDKLEDHYRWAATIPRDRWTKIRRDLRSAIEARERELAAWTDAENRDKLVRPPALWVLMGTPAGNAKTTALVYEGAKAIMAGRTVRYVASSMDWRRAANDKTGRILGDLIGCDLLLVDEIHWLAKLPDWIVAEAMGVIDERYRKRSRLQCLGAGTMPIVELVPGLPPGLADRFELHFGAAEDSQRRLVP